ncbi:MAG: membrane protein insertion efficiency factor YidD [Rhodospirillales bacterium]
MSAAAAWVVVELAEFYQSVVSPVLPGSCRFYPSCSAYAIKAVQRHGPFHGSVLAIRRILRCNPWGPCGHDPVPPVRGHLDHDGPCRCNEKQDDLKSER